MASKNLYRNMREILEPSHTALVVWDVQNALVNSSFNKDAFLLNIKAFLNAARAAGIPLVYTKITPLPLKFESPWRIYSQMKRSGVDDPDKLPRFMEVGSPQAEIHTDVTPQANDIVLNKHTTSVFIGSSFELLMRNAGIETIIFTGISTEVGIASSARDSSSRGFYTVVVEDCVSSPREEMHKAALMALKNVTIVATSSEIIDAWK